MNYLYCVVSNAGDGIDIHVNRMVMQIMCHLAPVGVDACGRGMSSFLRRTKTLPHTCSSGTQSVSNDA